MDVLTLTVYRALLEHSWLRNDLSGVVDVEQAGYLLRADYELCYSEVIQNKPNIALFTHALDSVDWHTIAQALFHRWNIPLPVQKRTRQRQLEHHELMEWVESAETAEEMQERAEHANVGYPVFVTEEVVD